MNKSLSEFEKNIGLDFADKKLLKQAFVHRSYLNEHRGFVFDHNERLEFLGDAVLELATTDFLFKKYPNKPEGELTSYRAALVNANTCSALALELGVNELLFLSKGEAKDTGRARQIILANTFEAIIGAIYLDRGYEAAFNFIQKYLLDRAEEIIKKTIVEDYKSYFQKKAQEVYGITPSYQLLKEIGPDHNKVFTIALFIGEEQVAVGEGLSKQEAEQEAAKSGLAKKGW
ncbi:MAG TPA: ribonuclease III [Candidatus Paceibacterota bacterium]|jgi:ribonuclease-3|nr:ribonuclease III [Candidatus Paceibacterota bacterium]HOH11097.1 ribonuclease III [Candidatus Paceibacterota bacterium]HOY11073.1 ribonuclease III [Candidatus Paceibacterota bacterium]HPB60196.1 ribonuclease III [Candidatus Paceibacterota bacterium]HPI24644.1 ribonuclease III [Candidatus Paceibacterota bacterium]